MHSMTSNHEMNEKNLRLSKKGYLIQLIENRDLKLYITNEKISASQTLTQAQALSIPERT